MQNNKTNKESPNKREIRTPTRYNDFDTTAVPGQRRSKEETNDKPSYNGGKDKPSPQPKTGGHSMIKNSTKLQKERKKEGLDTHTDSVCESVITFYPEWYGKLSDLNEWSTKQGGTAFQKSNDNTLTAKLDKNLTVNCCE